MKSLFSFLVGEIIITAILLLNEASEVTYYVTVSNEGANWQCPTGQCYNGTLQDFVESIGKATCWYENGNTTLTLLFMPGTHNVNFVNAPQDFIFQIKSALATFLEKSSKNVGLVMEQDTSYGTELHG